jgi:ubiquinone/menaquinone biosynthesis C-methylase UbiE
MAGVREQSKELRKLWSNFQSSRVLLTANNYRIFDHLETEKLPAAVARKINADKRATEILLDGLAGLDLLKKKNGKYRNNGMTSRFLVTGSPYYHGDIIRHGDSLWKNWSGLDRVLKTGKPNRAARNQNAFIMGMHNISVLKAKEIINAIGMRNVRKALDLGGGPGTYALEIAKRGIQSVIFDTPETIRIAKRLARKEKVKNLDFIQGDFLFDEIGSGYDLVFISQVFHAYSARENIRILEKSRKSLNERGRIVVQEFFIGEDRTYPPWSAMFSINMLVNTKGGRCYSPREIKTWLVKTGFKKPGKKFVGDIVLVSAVK